MKHHAMNCFQCVFLARSVNEGFSRMLVSAFVSQLDPHVNELADLKTAVSEAVTNCIVHGYRGVSRPGGNYIFLKGEYFADGRVVVTVRDKGVGIADIRKAMQPLFTTDAEDERSGMGFTIMESFCDDVHVTSRPGKGTTVRLIKHIDVAQ